MKYELKKYYRNVSDQELLDDLRKIADQIGTDKVNIDQYDQKGKFHSATLRKRFGSWNKSLEKAGLKLVRKQDISDKELKLLEKIYILII